MAVDAKMTVLTDNVIKQITELFPEFHTSNRALVLKSIRAEDSLDKNDIAGQLKAKDNEQTWGVPIKATVQLVDKLTGKDIGRPSTVTIAKLPKLTNRFSFIVDGGEYQVDHLLRLKSGVYTKTKRDGNLVSEFNLRKGGVKNFELLLDRKTNGIKFKMKSSDAKVPVYPLMKVMGVSDDAMEQAWGKALFEHNKFTDPVAEEKALRRFWEFTKPGEGPAEPTLDHIKGHVYNYFNDTKLLPETTAITLGHPFEKVTGPALLAAATKLVKLERKEVEPDDRDSLVFKEVAHVEDIVPEKIRRSRAKIVNKIRNSLRKPSTTASEILQGGALFNNVVSEFFTQGGNLSERNEQTNPVQMLSGNFKTTIVSKDYGGISDPKKLGEEMQAINPSHFGFLDPMHTPESEKTGVTLHLGSGVFKDKGDLKTQVHDLSTGKKRDMAVPEFHHSAVVLPDQVTWKDGKPVPIGKMVKAKLPGGDIGHIEWSKAKLLMPTAKGMFSFTSNLIPFLPSDQGNRASTADKQIEQAISLKHREAPLVQSVVHPDTPHHTFEKAIGLNIGATRAPVAGKVVKVGPDSIHINDGKKTHEVHVYNHFPLNDPTTMIHSVPVVKVGDEVKAGHLLADSNFTKGGTLALGSNLRVGYIPYKGYNFEDGIVISQSAADKLTSEHLHKLKLDIDTDADRTNKHTWKAFSSRKATELTPEQWKMLDDDGVIKPGSVVKRGQVLATKLSPNEAPSLLMKKVFGTRGVKPWKDRSLVWEEDISGVVTRVAKSPNGKSVRVFVKTEQPAEIGDKLSGRHGNKGIITQILPDEKMPFTQTNGQKEHLEVLLNPSGVPTRMNVGQVLETAAAKIAKKTGKPYVVNNFAGAGHDYRQQVIEDLKKHDLHDEEMVYDPDDIRRPLGSVLVGPQYILKLKHQAEKKLNVRGGGTDLNDRQYTYDPDHQPQKGGAQGAQGFGSLEMYALLGHNARNNLREMTTYKSDMQGEDFWRRISEGGEPPPPKVPFAYNKFEAIIKGLGVDVRKEGTSMRMVPMTDRDVLKMANNGKNEIKKPALLLAKTFKPEKGGFFDPFITGHDGEQWSYLRLAEPLPNPIFVGDDHSKGPVPTLLSMKFGPVSVQDIDKIVTGSKTLNGLTGGKAILEGLKQVNVEEEIKNLRASLPSKRGNKKDQANRALKYLLALKDLNLKPHEAYVLHNVPVMPPQFRPVTPTLRGDVAKSSINDLYKNLAVVNERMGLMPAEKYGEFSSELRGALWNSFKALQSVGNYKPAYDDSSHGERKLKGLVDWIGSGEGEQPKEGYFQSKLMKRKHDLSIRSVIIPEPSLRLDEVGLPRNAAMELYKPYVVAQLAQRYAYPEYQALEDMKKQTPNALKALDEVMAERPLILKRDPVLHKFGVMAFKPKVVDGKAIKIHPLITGGYNADFDGDTMAGTVPMSKSAVEEAKRMFPTANLFSPSTYKAMHVPSQEFLLGLNLISKWGDKTNHVFANIDAAKKAHEAGTIKMTDVIQFHGVKEPTTLGRTLIATSLPPNYAGNHAILHKPEGFKNGELTGGVLANIIEDIAKKHPAQFDVAADKLKNLGSQQAFKHGFSIGLKDFAPLPERAEILGHAQKQVDHLKDTMKGHNLARDEKIKEIWDEATNKLEDAISKRHRSDGNRLAQMVFSGSRGKASQLRQMIAAPVLVHDAQNRVVLSPITRSYGEGLDVGDYWLAQHGARKGTLQRASGTRDPGAMTKDIINSTINTLIVSEDCKTPNGVMMPIDHADIHDRFLAKDHGPFRAGTLITPAVTDRLRGTTKNLLVRSPLKCQHGTGICAKCYGLNENAKLHPVGTNIGILSGQALGEPATQMAMDSFHTGGIAQGRGGSSVSKIERLKQLLKMPKTLRGSAVLARADGPITAIRASTSGLGGHDVIINGITHHVRKDELAPGLKPGAVVQKGQSLSWEQADTHPKELLAITKDMPRVQQYLVDELYNKLYKKEGVRQRNVETVVRSLTNLTRIKDPGSSHWEVGDIVPHSVVEEHNRELRGSKMRPVIHEPELHGSGQIPHKSTDWMARLNYQRLGDTLQQGAAQAWKSDIHGTHPIPGLAYGKEFGPHPKVPPGKKPFVY